MNFSPEIYIIILNWNNPSDTINCLQSLENSQQIKHHVLLIDNGSTDQSVEQICTWARKHYALKDQPQFSHLYLSMGQYPDFDFKVFTIQNSFSCITVKDNLGFAGGCNLGITYALNQRADYIFLLNNDADVGRGALAELVQTSIHAHAPIVGALVLDHTGENLLFAGSKWPQNLFHGLFRPIPQQGTRYWESSYAEGSGMLLSASFLKQRLSETGYFFDPSLFMYCEDLDLCLYGKSQQQKCVISGDAVIYHKGSNSSGGSLNPRSYYYLTRNRIYMANRWLHPFEKLMFHLYYFPSRLIVQTIQLLKNRRSIAYSIRSGVLDGYSQVFGKWEHH